MKKHAIIPIFITHRGCPHLCVFCDQKRITHRTGDVTPEMAENTIKTWLTTLDSVEEVEISFYGGSFTAIPMPEQCAFLEIAKKYKDMGKVQKIHLSTRPDYIDREILDNLKKYSVDVIELGVQSFDPEVLKLSGRGHDAACVYKASELIKSYGFTLGIQLMIGLPGDSFEACVMSANETVKIGPAIARLYPTVTIKNTELYDMYESGTFKPLDLEEALERTKAMYEILDNAGINIIRVGLKSSDIMDEEMGFHPAFRQLVESRIARDKISKALESKIKEKKASNLSNHSEKLCFIVSANDHSFGNIFGHKAENRSWFREKYGQSELNFVKDNNLKDGEYSVTQA